MHPNGLGRVCPGLLRFRPAFGPYPPHAGGPAMLSLFPTRMRTCEGVERRDFLKAGVLSGLGLSLPALFAGREAHARQGQASRDVNCILIWTRGGTSHH